MMSRTEFGVNSLVGLEVVLRAAVDEPDKSIFTGLRRCSSGVSWLVDDDSAALRAGARAGEALRVGVRGDLPPARLGLAVFRPPLTERAFVVRPGLAVRPVRSAFGVGIIYCDERKNTKDSNTFILRTISLTNAMTSCKK